MAVSGNHKEKAFRPYHPGQVYLLPLSLNEWLPEGHLARFTSDTVDHLDLSVFLDADSGRVRPASLMRSGQRFWSIRPAA